LIINALAGGWIVSLDNTVAVAVGQFMSNRARFSAKSVAIGCSVVVSGVVLHPEMPTKAATGNIQSTGVFFMCVYR
jgi:hypothetical protein